MCDKGKGLTFETAEDTTPSPRGIVVKYHGQSAILITGHIFTGEKESSFRLYLLHVAVLTPQHEVQLLVDGKIVHTTLEQVDLCVPPNARTCHPSRHGLVSLLGS